MASKFIYAIDEELEKDVAHVVRGDKAVSLVTGNKIQLTDEEIDYINNYKL